MKKLLWYVIAGTRGGVNRARIINTLKERPYNTNQLAEKLDLDYKTIQHHLKVLKKNHLITIEGNGYGSLNFLTEKLVKHFDQFLEIWNLIKKEGVEQ